MEQKLTGVVKWFSDAKGFGFITGTDGTDYFAHYTGILSKDKRKTLADNDSVSFSAVKGKKGLQAVNIHKLD